MFSSRLPNAKTVGGAMASASPYPFRLSLDGQRVLIVGGGMEGAAQACTLLAEGALVSVVATTPGPALNDLARAAKVALATRHFRGTDLAGIALCVLVGDDNDGVAEAARRRGVLFAQAERRTDPDDGTRVFLVGAGPGDPGLLTLRALDVLRAADVVLHDRLVDSAIIDLAPTHARRIDVGKRCGRHSMSQDAINKLILSHARRGARVVRLKGGDPFVFGRGGEELDCLREAGFAVEVIPGITAACAVAARLGIPLTHRDIARSLHFVTGHGSNGEMPELDWRMLASPEGTVAIYMANRTLSLVTAKLMHSGLPGSTPAVAIENATRANERSCFATLADLPEALAAAGFTGPTLVLVGQVVALSAKQSKRAAA